MQKKHLLLFALALCVYSNSFSQTKRKTIIPEISEQEETLLAQNSVDFSSVNIDVYPSPFQDKFYVKSSRQIKRIQILDEHGREVLRLDDGNELDLTFLSIGEYILKVTFNNGEALRVIQKN